MRGPKSRPAPTRSITNSSLKQGIIWIWVEKTIAAVLKPTYIQNSSHVKCTSHPNHTPQTRQPWITSTLTGPMRRLLVPLYDMFLSTCTFNDSYITPNIQIHSACATDPSTCHGETGTHGRRRTDGPGDTDDMDKARRSYTRHALTGPVMHAARPRWSYRVSQSSGED